MNNLNFFDMFILCILAFVILGVLTGRGDQVLSILNGKNRKSPFDPKKEIKVIFWYAIVLLATEALLLFSDTLGTWAIFVGVGIALVGGGIAAFYLKKYGMKKK